VLGNASSELPSLETVHQQLNLFPAENFRAHLNQRLPPISHRPFKQPILWCQSTDHSAMLAMDPLAIRHQPVLHSASSASKQTSPTEIIVYMHHPETLRRKPFQEPHNPAPLNFVKKCPHSTAMASVRSSSHVQYNLDVRICSDELRSETRSSCVGHSYWMTYQLVKLGGRNFNVAVRLAMPFVAAKSPPAGRSWWIFEEDVPVVVCVVASQHREGSLGRLRACSWEVDA
jgi:hypothetical protein